MCLAIPMTVESVDEGTCVAGYGGVRTSVQTALVDDVQVGDSILVHAGFAIEKLDPEEAERTMELLRELGQIHESERQADVARLKEDAP